MLTPGWPPMSRLVARPSGPTVNVTSVRMSGSSGDSTMVKLSPLQWVSGYVCPAGPSAMTSCPFGSARFLDLVSSGSWDTLCQHAALTGDYRNPDFDILGAVSANTHHVVDVLKKMLTRGLSGVVLTGTGSSGLTSAAGIPLGHNVIFNITPRASSITTA